MMTCRITINTIISIPKFCSLIATLLRIGIEPNSVCVGILDILPFRSKTSISREQNATIFADVCYGELSETRRELS